MTIRAVVYDFHRTLALPPGGTLWRRALLEALDDARKWRFYTYIFDEQVPPPWETVRRCDAHDGFGLQKGEIARQGECDIHVPGECLQPEGERRQRPLGIQVVSKDPHDRGKLR